jgi:hypothetical protein
MRLGAKSAVAVAAILPLAIAALSGAAIVQRGDLRITATAQIIKPFKLPRDRRAPISVFVAGRVAAIDGGVPEQLQRLSIRVNRHGRFSSRGLPVCPISRVQPATTSRALAACAPALVGSGRFWANIVLPDQGAYPTRGRLLLFNGRTACSRSQPSNAGFALSTSPTPPRTTQISRFTGVAARPDAGVSEHRERAGAEDVRHLFKTSHSPVVDRNLILLGGGGMALPPPPSRHHRSATSAQGSPRRCQALFAHIFTSDPFNSSFVIVFQIRRLPSGTYGTELSASLPQALGEWGYVDRIKLTLGRTYRHQGRLRTYFSAGCPAPEGVRFMSYPLARATFTFAGGRNISTLVSKTCGVKR